MVPKEFLAALALAAAFFGLVAWDQSYWWRLREDYSFGWLVPLFVAFVVQDRWPKITAALAACTAEASPRVGGWRKALLHFLAGVALLGGALLFLLGAFYRAGAGASHPGSLAIALGAGALSLALLLISSPQSPRPARSGLGADARVRLVGLFLFPVLVWLVSAPMVSFVESGLNLALLHAVVTVVAAVFEVLGLPLEQQGNVLALPTGNVGVEEACSGIRSLTGCLFAGSFLAAVFLESAGRKILLVASALVLALLTNLVRSLFLTAWAYRYGPQAIEGTVHDVAGYAVLGLTVAGLLALLPLFKLRIALGESPARAESE